MLGDGSVEAAQVSIAVSILAPDKSGDFHDALIAQSGQVERRRRPCRGRGSRPRPREARGDDALGRGQATTITEVYALAHKLSLTGTPSYVTAQEVVVGAVGYDALKEKIATPASACATDALLSAGGRRPASPRRGQAPITALALSGQRL